MTSASSKMKAEVTQGLDFSGSLPLFRIGMRKDI